MSGNYNYDKTMRAGGATDKQELRVAVFAAFDRLGPQLRQVINEARIMWDPVDLYYTGVVDRGMPDEALSRLVKGNDAKMLEKLDAQRIALRGVWAPSDMERWVSTRKRRKAVYGHARRRNRRPSRQSVADAVRRATRTPVPRINDLTMQPRGE